MEKWTVYNKTWEEFCDQGFNDPATIIVIRGVEYLLGDINYNGGQCDCCSIIYDKDIVEKYRRIQCW